MVAEPVVPKAALPTWMATPVWTPLKGVSWMAVTVLLWMLA